MTRAQRKPANAMMHGSFGYTLRGALRGIAGRASMQLPDELVVEVPRMSLVRDLERQLQPYGGPTIAGVNTLDRVSFTTHGGTRVQGGRVLEVDLLAQLPLRVEYMGPEGKRIERFHPSEFKTFTKEQA